METLKQLHHLIQLMDVPERRYVTWYLSLKQGDKQKNDTILYNILFLNKNFNITIIEKALKPYDTLHKYTAVSTRHLRQSILRALRHYRDESSLNLKMRNMLEEDSILKEKMMTQERAKHLQRLFEMADQYQVQDIKAETINRQIDMMLENGVSKELIAEKIMQLQNTAKENQLIWTLQAQYHSLFMAYRNGEDFRQQKYKELSIDLVRQIEDQEQLANSFQAKHLIYNMLYFLSSLSGDPTRAYQVRLKQRLLWETNPDLIELRPADYKIVLSNYLVSAFNISNLHPFKEVLHKLKSLPTSSLNEEGEVFQNLCLLELLWHLNNNRHEEALAMVPEIMSGLEKYASKINDGRKLAILINVAILCFLTKKYSDCLDYINHIHSIKTTHRQDIQIFASILELICHFELGNLVLLESLSRSIRRFLERNNRLFDYERQLFKLLRKVFQASSYEVTLPLQQLMEYLKEVKDKPGERRPMCSEELYQWAVEKIRTLNQR